MGCTRLFKDNYLSSDVIAAAYVSSAQAAFPASNLYNAQRRSKVWRSDGYWKIVSGFHVIKFTSDTGDWTGTVTPAVYTSTTSFLQAVEDAFSDEDVSNNYTVSQDPTTGKIVIETDSTVFTIKWTQSVEMAATLGFSDDANDTGDTSYTADFLRIHTEEHILWDLGLSTNPQALIIIGQRNSPIKISPSAVIKLQGNENNEWSDPSFEMNIDYNEEVMFALAENGLHTEALRWWRLYIYDPENPYLYIELGSVFLGDYIQPARGAVQFPLQASYIDRSQTVFSAGGQTFSDIKQKSERFGMQFNHLTVSEKEEIDDHWDYVGTSLPFFIQLDPNLAFSTRVGKFIRFVKFENEPSSVLTTPQNWSCSMVLREEL